LLYRPHRHYKLLLIDIFAVIFFNHQLGLLVATDSGGEVDGIPYLIALIRGIGCRHGSFRQHLNIDNPVVRLRCRPLIGLFI
jgi:hypothetical protein